MRRLSTPYSLVVIIFLMGLFTLSATTTLAQGGGGQKGERIKALKVGYLTQELKLTTEEAQTFWPVYNEFQDKKRALHKERGALFREAKQNYEELSDKELEKLVDDGLTYKQRELNLELEYHSKFKEVLPIKKVALLYKAERDFHMKFIRELREKTDKPDGVR